MQADPWKDLHQRRFPGIIFDCGNSVDPGLLEGKDIRNWSRRHTTADQLRIEKYLGMFDLRSKRVLHVGVGNSGLARRFHRLAEQVVGTAVDEPEIEVGRSASLPNYTVVLHNKYSGMDELVAGKFDFIVDNNPTSACCCMTHLRRLLNFYDAKLADGGQIVTDREGLDWVAPGNHHRWSFDFDDLAAIAALAGLNTTKINRCVYVLSRGTPAAPGLRPRLRNFGRRAKTWPGDVVRGARGIARVARIIARGSVRRLS